MCKLLFQYNKLFYLPAKLIKTSEKAIKKVPFYLF